MLFLRPYVNLSPFLARPYPLFNIPFKTILQRNTEPTSQLPEIKGKGRINNLTFFTLDAISCVPDSPEA